MGGFVARTLVMLSCPIVRYLSDTALLSAFELLAMRHAFQLKAG